MLDFAKTLIVFVKYDQKKAWFQVSKQPQSATINYILSYYPNLEKNIRVRHSKTLKRTVAPVEKKTGPKVRSPRRSAPKCAPMLCSRHPKSLVQCFSLHGICVYIVFILFIYW